jgi:predicted Zn-dependent protease
MSDSSRTPLAALLALLLLALGAGCTTPNPATGGSDFTPLMSPAQERQVGASEHPKILRQFGGVYDDPKVGAWIARLGGRLVAASDLPREHFTFTVLDTDMANAFALPGGYVYITRGLLALTNTEAEVAGVLAHEIGHVTARHTAKRMNTAALANLGAAALGILTGSNAATQLGQVVGAGVVAQYSQGQELEADALGIRYMSRIGYDPMAQADMLASLGRARALEQKLAGRNGKEALAGLFASHPSTDERVRRATEAARQRRADRPGLVYGREAYLNAVDGMIYGDSPEQGFVRGRTFVHPKLRFTFTAPPEFELANRPGNVVGQDKNGGAFVFDLAPKLQARDALDYLRNEWAPRARLDGLERLHVNGMPAAAAHTRVRTQQGMRDLQLLAIDFGPGTIYRFIFLMPPGPAAGLTEEFQRTTYSFRRLSEAEAAKQKPYRIRIFQAGPGDSIASMARYMVLTEHPVERFRILNALPEGERLRPGDKVKVVVEE